MQPSQGQNLKGDAEPGSGEFFVPDLCGPRPVFVIVMLAELLVLTHTLASSTLPRFDWGLLAVSSLLVQWVVLLSAALLCLLRVRLGRVSLVVAAAACVLTILAVTAVSSFLAMAFYPQLTGGGFFIHGAGGFGEVDGHWWLIRNLAVALILAGIVLRYFYLQQQLRLREKSELQARLDSLRSRIRPHFLFNTMNSIASLIAFQPEAAEKAVEDLSELFRASLQELDKVATVADELRLCELYLGIEQLRLGDRLQVVWQVEASVRDRPMPSLILQPLVENAVYHGISQLTDGGTVTVNIGYSKGMLRARIENPIPEHSTHSQGHHMALHNIEQRLHALFGEGATMVAISERGSYCVQLNYPLEEVS